MPLSNMFAKAVFFFFIGFCVLRLLGWNDPPLLWILGVFVVGYVFAEGWDARSAKSVGYQDVILRLDQRSLQLPGIDGVSSPAIVMVDDIVRIEVVNSNDGVAEARGVVVEGSGEPKLVAAFRRPIEAERLRGLLIGELKEMGARFFVRTADQPLDRTR